MKKHVIAFAGFVKGAGLICRQAVAGMGGAGAAAEYLGDFRK